MQEIQEILASHSAERSSLIPILQDIQESLGYLSEEALDQISCSLKLSINEIYGVATFYNQFRFQPPGEHTIHVCLGTACHVRGGEQIMDAMERELKVKSGETTGDGKFSLERVACFGCCALAPVVAVDGKVHAQLTAKKVPSIISQYHK